MNQKTVKTLTLVALFFVFFVGFNLLDHQRTLLSLDNGIRYFKKWSFVKFLFYWCVYSLCIVSIMVVIFSKSKLVRGIGLTLIFIFGSMEFAYQNINGFGTGFFEILVALWEFSFAGQAVRAFTADISMGLLMGLLMVATLVLIINLVKIRFKLRWLILVPITFALTYMIIWRTFADTDQFPVVFKIPLLALYTSQSPLASERDPIALEPPGHTGARKILFIIDESIGGDYLGINGYPRPTTPYLESILDKILNFGIVCSAGNCSQTSNAILRTGVRLDQLPDREQHTLTAPTIFSYAKAAGYKTYFLEGQYAPGTLPPLMSKYDLKDIDEFYQIPKDDEAIKGFNTDFILADRIKEILKSDEPVFILVNKRGVHFPYEDDYPLREQYFKPTLGRSGPFAHVHDHNNHHEEEDEEIYKDIDKTRMINSFCNGIRWNVDRFFQDLIPAIDLDDETVLLYTSDHGQSLHDKITKSTHCITLDPPSSSAAAAMFLMGGYSNKFFAGGVARKKNRVSHFQVFPSVLVFMGYAEQEVLQRYGDPLWINENKPRYFISGDLFGRGSKSFINEFHFQPYYETSSAD